MCKKHINKSSIVKAAGFPLAVQCNELIVECAKHYDPNRRMIVGPDRRELAYLSKYAINEAFQIPQLNHMITKSKDAAKVVYEDDPDGCEEIINKYWMVKSKARQSKLPNRLHKIDFKEEFRDLITFLGRVFGIL